MPESYVVDFETTTRRDDCRVWSFGIINIHTLSYDCGITIEEFFEYLRGIPSATVYFHNLKFDGDFLINYMLHKKYELKRSKDKLNPREFKTLITDTGVFYCIDICISEKCMIHVRNSLNLLPFKVEELPSKFGIDTIKGEIDYTKDRPIGYKPTLEEYVYQKNDCLIVAKCLNILFEYDLNKMTLASNALYFFKRPFGKNFREMFPILSYDKLIRKSYKGGYTYLNKAFASKMISDGIVLDVNSLYPSRMYYDMMPYGVGVYGIGQYKKDELMPLYIQKFACTFNIKEGYLPTVQIKNNMRFSDTEYLESSGDESIILCLTSVDFELFMSHYNVYNIEYIEYWKYTGINGLFNEYIDFWMDIKEKADRLGNKGMRQIAKLMLNSLYGKFGTNPESGEKLPYLKEDGSTAYHNIKNEDKEPVYLPLASFITAYARKYTIDAAQANCDRFIYCDTDSLHLIGTEIPDNIEVHPTKLGAWKHESTFTEAKFLRQKTYMEKINNEWHITACGMSNKAKDNMTIDLFNHGNTIQGNLKPIHVSGGIVLEPAPFTIR